MKMPDGTFGIKMQISLTIFAYRRREMARWYRLTEIYSKMMFWVFSKKNDARPFTNDIICERISL